MMMIEKNGILYVIDTDGMEMTYELWLRSRQQDQ